jgi:hypothetical protein
VTLTRIIFLLLGGLALMLAVVVLRTETTRVHTRLAALDKRELELRSQIQAAELELARWRSPTLIRDRMREFRRATLQLPEDSKKTGRSKR